MTRAAQWVSCLASLLLGACHLADQSNDQTPADQSVEVDPADYAEQVDEKLRRFSACRYTQLSVIADSWERYNDQVGTDGRPKHRKEGVYLHGINSNTLRSCYRMLDAAKAPPSMPKLEINARACVELASQYAEQTRKLERYLDDETWKTDDWAGLFDLDGDLRTAHADWQSCDLELQQGIDVRHVENDPILLGVLETRRSPLEVATRKLMLRARPMVRCMAVDASPLSETKADKRDCAPLHAAFVKASGEFSQVYAAQRSSADKVFWMTTFANDVEEFQQIADDVHAKLASRKIKLTDLQELGDAYSSLVRDAETLDFDFP